MTNAARETDRATRRVAVGPSWLGALARRARSWGPVALGFCAFVGVLIRPTPARVAGSLPANLGDPSLLVWILRWGTHALASSPRTLFDANIFWPRPLTLAYSESLLPLAPVYGVIYVATKNWALSFNIFMFALIFFALFAVFALARWLTGRRDAAFVAAVAFVFSAYGMTHVGQLQLQTTGFLALAFLLLFRLLEAPTLGRAAVVGVVNAALVLSALYYGAAYAVAAVVVVAGHVLITRFRPGPGFVPAMLVVAGVTAALVLPATLPYLELRDDPGFRRPLEAEWGIDPVDFIQPAVGSYVYRALEPAPTAPNNWEHRFFLGVSVTVLAVVGVVTVVRGRRAPIDRQLYPAHRVRYVGLLAAAGVATLILAAGPTIGGVDAPFTFFYDHVPGFGGLRVMARLAVVFLLAATMFAAYGYIVFTRWAGRFVPRRNLLLVATSAVMLVEFAAPLPWVHLPADDATLAVYKELRSRPQGPLAELPVLDPRTQPRGWAFVEAPRMVYSTLDWHPRVNGYSGFIPEGYFESVHALNAFPSQEAVDHARGLGLRYLVLHEGHAGRYHVDNATQLRELARSVPAGMRATRHGDSYLVELDGY